MEPFDATFRFLADVRRELAKVARGEVVFAALIVAALAVLLGFGTALALDVGPARWGWLPLGLGALALAALVWRLGVRPGRRRRDATELALWVEERVDGLESGLVTAVQAAPMVQASAADAGTLGFSPALATAAASRTAVRVRAVRPDRLPDRTRLSRLRWGALGTAAALALIALIAPEFYARGAQHLTAAPLDDGEEGRLVDVAVSQLDLEVRAPSYTDLKPRRIPRSAGDVEAFEGSEVRFSGTTLVPATSAALVLESAPESRWMLELESDGTLRGAFQVGANDRYQFVLVDLEGELVRERVWRRVTAREDRAPEITLLLPETDLEVKPEAEVSFFFEATDDLGLAKIELVIQDEDGDELVREALGAAVGETIVKDDATVQVARLGLEPGESADVWFEAFDQNSVSGPGIGKSAKRKLTLYSPADEHDEILADLKQLIERMLDVLADRLESPVDKQRPDLISGFARAHNDMLTQTMGILGEMDRLSRLLSTDPLASSALRDGLRGVRDNLGGVNEQERAHLAKWDEQPDLVEPRVWVTLLEQTNDESVDVLEQGILHLKKLIDGALKDAILEAGREMLETQNEIMELLKELKETNDPAAREAVLKKLDKLRQKLRELQQKLARLQERAPYENQNPAQRPSQNQQDAKSLAEQMAEIERLLEEGKIDEAMKMLEELSKSTQEMMAGLQNDLEGIGGGGNRQQMRQMAEVSGELERLANGQRGIQGETSEAGRQIDERQRQELMERAREQLDDMRGRAQQIREQLGQAGGEGLHPDDQATLEGLEGAAAELEQALENAQIGEAQGKASQVAEGARSLGQEIGESEAREMERQRLEALREAMEQLEQAGQAAQQLAEELANMKPEPGQGLTPEEGKRLGQLGAEQGELDQRLQQLQEKVHQLEEAIPQVGEALREPLEQAEQAMQEATRELEERRPGGAQQNQQEALEKLQQAQQQLKEAMEQQQDNAGQTDEMTGINDPRAEVGIPEDNPNAGPRDLREEILRAMGERAPESYKDAIRKFYEELTK